MRTSHLSRYAATRGRVWGDRCSMMPYGNECRDHTRLVRQYSECVVEQIVMLYYVWQGSSQDQDQRCFIVCTVYDRTTTNQPPHPRSADEVNRKLEMQLDPNATCGRLLVRPTIYRIELQQACQLQVNTKDQRMMCVQCSWDDEIDQVRCCRDANN